MVFLEFLDDPYRSKLKKPNLLRSTGLYAEGGVPVLLQVPSVLNGSDAKVIEQSSQNKFFFVFCRSEVETYLNLIYSRW